MRLYRAALRAYPPRYRAERGDEILVTLEEAHGDARASLGEILALLRAGLRERDRDDAHGWRRGFAALALPLAVVNAAIALTGLRIAFTDGPGRWWPVFALIACALALAVALRARRSAAILALANVGLIAADAATMSYNHGTAPHIRLLEHAPPYGGEAFPPLPATAPSNPTELVPFAVVLALAVLCLSPGGLPRRAAAGRVALAAAAVATLTGVALAFPDYKFSLLLPVALVVLLVGLAAGVLYRGALAVALGLLVAIAPSVFWYLSRGYPFEHRESYGLIQTSATRDVVPGFIGMAVLAVTGAAACALAARARAARRA